MSRASRRRASGVLTAAAAAGLTAADCGFQPPLPATLPNISLIRLQQIQDDERMTDAERRQEIRGLVGAADDEAGNRLVDFLLNFNVP